MSLIPRDRRVFPINSCIKGFTSIKYPVFSRIIVKIISMKFKKYKIKNLVFILGRLKLVIKDFIKPPL